MQTSIVHYHTHQGVIIALVVPTSRKLHVIRFHAKNGLIHRAVTIDEERHMRQSDVTLKKGVRQFGVIARRIGSTKAARTWLAKAREAVS